MPFTTNNISNFNKERVNKILEVIMAYARLDFTQKTEVIANNDMLDAIGAGVNMLGEELENSTISLKEKERMLKEIHHRVKNNLQIVSSLLNLQSENIYDPNFLNLMSASKNRINSIALVHEMLYSAPDLKEIEIREYIKRLSLNISQSIARPDSRIIFSYDISDNYFFDIDRMVPLGLIINEIITNSLKYAFPKNEGTISISMCCKNGQHVLIASDDGIGLPENFELKKNTNLGSQLIEMLTNQINGIMDINCDNGTCYKIVFV